LAPYLTEGSDRAFWTQPTPSPETRGWLKINITSVTFVAIIGHGHLSMFRRGCQTFRPIVRPLLSALTELDPDVAVAPEHPNLSIWIRSGGLLNIRRYLHPRLPRRQSLWLSPQEKTFVVTKSPEAKLGLEMQKAVKSDPGERTADFVGQRLPQERGRDQA